MGMADLYMAAATDYMEALKQELGEMGLPPERVSLLVITWNATPADAAGAGVSEDKVDYVLAKLRENDERFKRALEIQRKEEKEERDAKQR